jgi:tetratricopeptide (TPR) repeat protein
VVDDRRAEIDQRRYDPRREERRRTARLPLPDDVDPQMLDGDVRRELRSLSKDTADAVARHLVVVGRTLDDDPELALRHAQAARALAGRVGAVREAAGLAAYAAGEWAEALSELRAARRITGSAAHLAVMADCERGLGRPERALTYGDDPTAAGLTQDERVELAIVLSGARRDLGQADAAVVLLEGPAQRTRPSRPWAPRLWYALADALQDAGRQDDARRWFLAAAEADETGQTDAGERLLELDGIVLEDLQDDGSDDDEPDGLGAAPAAGAAEDPATPDDPAPVDDRDVGPE